MKPLLWERIKIWWCEHFGHKLNQDKAWTFNNQRHAPCTRCLKVISKDIK